MKTHHAIIAAAFILAAALWFGPNRYQFLLLPIGDTQQVIRAHTATGAICLMPSGMMSRRYQEPLAELALPKDRGQTLSICN